MDEPGESRFANGSTTLVHEGIKITPRKERELFEGLVTSLSIDDSLSQIF